MDRRIFIAGAAVAPISATQSTAKEADPIVAQVEAWRKAEKEFYSASEQSIEKAAFDRMWEITRNICTSKPVSIEGVIAQLEHYSDAFGDEIFDSFFDNLDGQLFNSALNGLKALTT